MSNLEQFAVEYAKSVADANEDLKIMAFTDFKNGAEFMQTQIESLFVNDDNDELIPEEN
jgi:hypothetical protein